MRIAFLIGEFPSVSETFILSQITALIDCGHQVDIYAECPSKVVKKHGDIDRYELQKCIFYYPTVPKNWVARALGVLPLLFRSTNTRLRPLLEALNIYRHGELAASMRLFYRAIPFVSREDHHYDIVHCHHGHVGAMGVKLREIGAVAGQIVTSFHGYDVNVIPALSGSDVYKELFQKANVITANSQFTIEKLMDLHCAADKIVRLPVGLDVSLYSFREREVSQENAPIRLLTVARLVEKKGIEYSIRAVSKVIEKYPNIQYEIVGDGPLLRRLQQLIVELRLQDSVHLLGWKTKEEVQKYYEQAHIFVLASVTAANQDREGQGLVLQEAQAMGLPVVATLHNGFPDSVIQGRSAFLVPERDVTALVDRLMYLIENPGSWAEMGHVGRKYVEENFDITDLNQQLLDIYRKVQMSKGA
ncbi:GDP-mannose-dependent alpha-(1-6)-phosphatidylinositol monomannoside mannosyltransferase [Acaryochloris thomasi RCC1774]|uniref:GDP-mannose-dependent alpha-(1-6)-phosphatidylinositol monomannoside mannosyltransferase n=1 Tax=Acaryochloris thomasi RCC1774 TaxID=1764569 RepID=A0A2W1JL24_9CYAN|nr:glycosyltransferase [Acaryochloris thomasi]PZD71622.1 GDP-mannose-dependent alpha-(1-6)-phosphatidylinositol monomannoside mannosyltransferase [Acaryochloris thomasi RCC1774]